MGVRKGRFHTDTVRDKIQSAQLVKFLQDHAINGNEVKKTQISAAIALLRKTIPDLQSIEGSLDLHHHAHEEALKELK